MPQNNQDIGLQLQIPDLEQFKDLKFIQSETNPADLIVQLPDGTEVVFPNYIPLAQAGAPPALTLEDGTVVPGSEIVELIGNLDYNLIATAAGGDAGGRGGDGGGAAFTADPSGLLGDDIGHGPYAGGVPDPHEVEFPFLGAGDQSASTEDLPFEAIDDHVIHNQQAFYRGTLDNPIDIPDVALRHNDIYPRGTWDLTSVENPGPASPYQSNFEAETVGNSDPGGADLGMTTFYGSNTTARFDAGSVADSYDNDGDAVDELIGNGLGDEDGVSGDSWSPYTGENKFTRQDWDLAATNLHTIAPTGGTPSDWDGASIFLYAGETITMTSLMNGNAVDVILAIDDPNVGTGSDPLGTQKDLNWDITNANSTIVVDGATGQVSSDNGNISTGESVSYTAVTSGWHYVGTGFAVDVENTGPPADGGPPGGSPPIDYTTLIEIDGVPYGEFDYNATDYVLSDGAHVIVEAREEDNLYWDTVDGRGWVDVINGTEGDNIIISDYFPDDLFGHGGDDVLIGRGGDDHLTGGADRDLFLFEDVADGNDTIWDFTPGDGDIINLDALFDALGVAAGDREVLADDDPAPGDNTILTIGDGGGNPHGLAGGFSITLEGIDVGDVDIAQLITNGNLVVDES